MKYLILFCSIVFASCLSSKTVLVGHSNLDDDIKEETKTIVPENIYATDDYLYGQSLFKDYPKVERPPTFKGGKAELEKLFRASVELDEAADLIVQSFHVVFQVDATGELSDFRMGSSANAPYADQILNASQEMPDWVPARLNNKKVTCIMRLGLTIKAGRVIVHY